MLLQRAGKPALHYELDDFTDTAALMEALDLATDDR